MSNPILFLSLTRHTRKSTKGQTFTCCKGGKRERKVGLSSKLLELKSMITHKERCLPQSCSKCGHFTRREYYNGSRCSLETKVDPPSLRRAGVSFRCCLASFEPSALVLPPIKRVKKIILNNTMSSLCHLCVKKKFVFEFRTFYNPNLG